MTIQEVIKKATNRFLGWKLPKDFNPDGGITYKQLYPDFEPIGTHLFTANQAEEMLRFILVDELTSLLSEQCKEVLKEVDSFIQSDEVYDLLPGDGKDDHFLSLWEKKKQAIKKLK